MIVNNLKDYLNNKLFIPVCDESIAIDRYLKLRTKGKKEEDVERIKDNIDHNIKRLRKALIKRDLWG